MGISERVENSNPFATAIPMPNADSDTTGKASPANSNFMPQLVIDAFNAKDREVFQPEVLAEKGSDVIWEDGVQVPRIPNPKIGGPFKDDVERCIKILGWAPKGNYFKAMKFDAMISHFAKQCYGPIKVSDPTENCVDNSDIGFKKPTKEYVEWAMANRPLLISELEENSEVKEKSPGNWTIVNKEGKELPADVEILPAKDKEVEPSMLEKWEEELNSPGLVNRNLKRIKKAAASKMRAEAESHGA